ncbi:MAG: type II secretion system F family protein [Burkholderiaceae bacterium]
MTLADIIPSRAAIAWLVAQGPVARWLAAVCIGLSLLLALVLLGTLVRQAAVVASRASLNAVPIPTRSWRWLQRACFWLAPWIGPWIPASMRFRLLSSMRRAGLDQVLTPEAFAAGQLLCAGFAILMAAPAMMSLGWPALSVIAPAALGGYWPSARLSATIRSRDIAVKRDLPAMLDLLALGLDAGASLPAALAMAADRGPHGALRDEIARLLRETHAGRARQDALAELAQRLADAGVRHAVAVIRSADHLGGDLAAMLREQSEQRRQERFLDAERRAMQAPVKLLLPLLLFIFPGTFLILLFPIVMRILNDGLLG